MRRRQLIRYAGAGLVSALGVRITSGLERAQAQTSGLSIRYLGHTCFLFTGGGIRILVNPFRSLGCTAGYKPPKVTADLVMISSQLLDEGAVEIVPGNPRLLYEPGVYQVGNLRIEGIRMDHDRVGGRRFGVNVAWKWKQSGIDLLHLGGAAAPISVEQKILMGRPDVLLLPVGGGPKAYNPEEARQAVETLNPRLVIPTQYRTQAAAKEGCDLVGVDRFLSLMSGIPVRKGGNTLNLRQSDLPAKEMVIQVMSHA
jgi:L-ascorbate metabolism protein UlaG (beta-lactamase superfamily)